MYKRGHEMVNWLNDKALIPARRRPEDVGRYTAVGASPYRDTRSNDGGTTPTMKFPQVSLLYVAEHLADLVDAHGGYGNLGNDLRSLFGAKPILKNVKKVLGWTYPEYAEKLDKYILSDDPPGEDTWIKQVYDTLKKGESCYFSGVSPVRRGVGYNGKAG